MMFYYLRYCSFIQTVIDSEESDAFIGFTMTRDSFILFIYFLVRVHDFE